MKLFKTTSIITLIFSILYICADVKFNGISFENIVNSFGIAIALYLTIYPMIYIYLFEINSLGILFGFLTETGLNLIAIVVIGFLTEKVNGNFLYVAPCISILATITIFINSKKSKEKQL